jgi:hypothetical protein
MVMRTHECSVVCVRRIREGGQGYLERGAARVPAE